MRKWHVVTVLALVLGLELDVQVEAQGPPPAAPVEIEVVSEENIVPTAVALGTTEAKRSSVVAATIEGYVIDYPIEEGVRVEEGAVLVRLRDTILRLELREAESIVEEIRQRHANAKRDLERARKLIETDAVTQKTLDERATTERSLALKIPQAEAQLEILRTNIAKKTVTAPFRGQVVREHTEIGEWISRGGPVATLIDVSSLYVRIDVPERYIRFVKKGASIPVQIAAAGPETLKGKVVSVADAGDPSSRTFPVRIELKNNGALRAGMSVRAEFPTAAPMRALVVSKDAILLSGTRSHVFVVGEGGQAEKRPVTTGVASGSRFSVIDGLRAGDRVVVRGNERIQPGMPLRILSDTTRETRRD